MPLPTGHVIGLMADNLRLRGSVLPIPRRNVTRWARRLGLPRGGHTVLYTGQMYQLVPYIERLVAVERKVSGTFVGNLVGLGRRVNRFVNVTAFLARPPASELAAHDQVPVNVANLLTAAGVEFGYLYADDLYSGALAWDLGLDDVVALQARRVRAAFDRHGVREVITIDPHTTHMLRSVYPTLLGDGYEVRVRSYLEVLAERAPEPRHSLADRLALHDSCVFARREGVLDQPRNLLSLAGAQVAEPADSGRSTWCCGGPVESLYPEKAAANARRRVEQLREVAADGVTMCPLCLVNLGKAAEGRMRFTDISHYLTRAYAPTDSAPGRPGALGALPSPRPGAPGGTAQPAKEPHHAT